MLTFDFCFLFHQIIDSLETKEIINFVLKKLPDPINVDLAAFEVVNLYKLYTSSQRALCSWKINTSG